MSVYVEVVIVNNLAVDALLIAATLTVRRRKIRFLPLAAASVAGAAVAVGYALLPPVWQIVVRALLAPLLCLIFDRYRNVKDYIISLAIFALMTFALGGIVTGIGNLIGVDIRGYIVLGLTAGGALTALLAIRAFIRSLSASRRKLCEVALVIGGERIRARALCDTGNTLTDCVTGKPVVIVSARIGERVLPPGDDGSARKGIEGYIEVKTVNGTSSMPIVKLDGVVVGENTVDAYAALSRRELGDYDVILQNTMF